MISRLIATIGLLVAGFVLLPAAPASACSCVAGDPDELAEMADWAFVGVLKKQRADDDDVAHRFAVKTAYKGDVHRTQDVVTVNADSAACGVDWTGGDTMVVLGRLDEEGRLATNRCGGSAASTGASYDAVVAALGTGSAPLPGQSVVELDRWQRDVVRWFTLAVAVIGLFGLGVLARRQWRARRPART